MSRCPRPKLTKIISPEISERLLKRAIRLADHALRMGDVGEVPGANHHRGSLRVQAEARHEGGKDDGEMNERSSHGLAPPAFRLELKL
jgi:hypothetical protein